MTINFIRIKNICLTLSIILCLTSLIIIYNKHISLGLEFSGGTEININIENNINIEKIKNTLYKNKNIKITSQGSNNTIKIKTKNNKNNIEEIKKSLNEIDPINIKIISIQYIGADINKDVIEKSTIAIIVAIISMSIYLMLRFNIILALSAVMTLLHDILIIVGIISLMEIELDLTIISALFTIFGYSVNDTIIIFDRIREYVKIFKKEKHMSEIINMSINTTLSRTISTSFSTLLVTSILIFFSGEALRYFSFILTLGIIVGTYSSIYISAIPLIHSYKKDYSR